MRRKTSARDSSLRSGFEGRFGLGRDRGEGGRVAHGEVREDLAVELDVRLAAPGHELVVRQALLPRRCIDTDDPEPPEDALLLLAVTVGVDVCMEDRLLGLAVGDVRLPDIALRLLERLAALLASVNGSLDALHFIGVCTRDGLVTAKCALTLLALLLQVVALHPMTAQDAAGPGHLEALLCRSLRFLFRAHFGMDLRRRAQPGDSRLHSERGP